MTNHLMFATADDNVSPEQTVIDKDRGHYYVEYGGFPEPLANGLVHALLRGKKFQHHQEWEWVDWREYQPADRRNEFAVGELDAAAIEVIAWLHRVLDNVKIMWTPEQQRALREAMDSVS